jgi:hypothetical protein
VICFCVVLHCLAKVLKSYRVQVTTTSLKVSQLSLLESSMLCSIAIPLQSRLSQASKSLPYVVNSMLQKGTPSVVFVPSLPPCAGR